MGRRGLSLFLLGGVVTLFVLVGCATPPKTAPGIPLVTGFYHEVRKGETLWGIAQSYQVDRKTLAEVNRLPDPAHLSVGQLLHIPGRRPPNAPQQPEGF